MPACGLPASCLLPSPHLLTRVAAYLPRNNGRPSRQWASSSSNAPPKARTRYRWRRVPVSSDRDTKTKPRAKVPSNVIKALRPSPNQSLYNAIVLVPGCENLFQRPPQNKVNLSYIDIRELTDKFADNGASQQRKLSEAPDAPFFLDTTEEVHRTLQGIVTDMIMVQLQPRIPSTAQETELLPQRDVVVLQEHGYSVDDAKLWARILTAPDARDAAAWILEATQQTKAVPSFVLLITLKRYRLGTEALRDMLLYATLQLEARQSSQYQAPTEELTQRDDRSHVAKASSKAHTTSPTPIAEAFRDTQLDSNHKTRHTPLVQAKLPPMDDASLFIFVVRLLRHARSVWPEAIVSIAKLFTQFMDVYMNQPGRRDEATNRKRRARVEFLYNSTLPLLAIPASLGPVQHVDVYQAAQFELLQRMAVSEPAPVALHRRAYRAIASVQLAMRKTEFEKEWARLKAKSWPPFMEPKIGADELKGPEHGQSRALRAIQRMREAGYGSGNWEQAAQILAGWDTHQTPTIQTRVQSLQSSLRLFIGRYRKNPHTAIWAARVRTTRNIDEAWACFLDYKDSVRRPSTAVYLVMLEKVHFEGLRTRGLQPIVPDEVQDLYAGDYTLVSVPRRAPREATYVRTQPPTFHALSMELLNDRRMPTGNRDISYLVKNATSLHDGVKYASLGTASSKKLAKCLEGTIEVKSLSPLEVPFTTLSAFLHLLCKFPSEKSTAASAFTRHIVPADDESRITHMLPVELAIRLLQQFKPASRPSWHTVMDLITRPNKKRTNDGIILNYRAVKKWVQSMDSIGLGTDFETFRLLCRILTQAAKVERSQVELESMQSSPQSGNIHSGKASEHRKTRSINSIEEGAFVKGWFHLLVSGRIASSKRNTSSSHKMTSREMNSSMPSLLETPPSPALHQYVRALGYLQDWSGLLDLACWMFEFRKELVVHNSRPHNGMRMLRKTVVALKACLEGHLAPIEENDKYPEKLLSSVQSLLGQSPMAPSKDQSGATDEQLDVFGWPSDEEVAEYVALELREPHEARWFES